MTRRNFFFIELLIQKQDQGFYEWSAEPRGGAVVLEHGNADSIEACIRAACSILGAAHGVELRYDGYCAGTFTGAEMNANPAFYATKASEVTRYFKAVEASLF